MRRNALLVLGLSAFAAAPAAAQSTYTPVFQAPYRAFARHEIGASLSDPGNGMALEGFYKIGQKNFDIGIRAGIWDPSGPAGNLFLIGGDARTRVITHNESFPLDGALTLGLGFQSGNGTSNGFIPIGLSLGRRIDLEGSRTSFIPYFQPVLTPTFGDVSDVFFSVGLGVDIKLTPEFDLRVSGAIGDMDGISVSAAFIR
jgi:hypothetical protein